MSRRRTAGVDRRDHSDRSPSPRSPRTSKRTSGRGERKDAETSTSRQSVGTILKALLVAIAAISWWWWGLGDAYNPISTDITRHTTPNKTLVAYIYSGTDGEYANNFRYFLREGIRPDDALVDYVLVIQQVADPAADPPADDLTRVQTYTNVRILQHRNACYDLGTLGWLYDELEREHEDALAPYSAFVWINSSVRGPFLPPYINPDTFPWTRAFTDKLTDDIKLVGATISCGESGPHPPTAHVQSYAVATDAVGLDLIRKNSTVLACYNTMQDVVFYGERGITETILNAGYGLDSLMARYQGMDWSRRGQLATIEDIGCNADMNPIQPGFYDGTDVDPMEVMFVKVKSAFLEAVPAWPSAVRANRLSIWKGERGDALAASDNDVLSRLEAEAERLEFQASERSKCFDWAFYLRANRQDTLVDEGITEDEARAAAAYEQFVTMGIFEGRPHRWTC